MRRSAATDELYFLTLTVVDWIDVFTRPEYKQYLTDNLDYCRRHKGLEIFAYVLMTNHLHLIAQVGKERSMSDWLRDFKSYTAKGLVKMIADNAKESRREWMLNAFYRHGRENEQNKDFQFWQNGSHPLEIPPYYTSMLRQKIEYIHDNPVRAGIVPEPEMYLYSSAHPANPLMIFL